MWHSCMPRLLNLYIIASQLGCFWHFRLDNSLSWGTDYPVCCGMSSTVFDSCPLDARSISFLWSHYRSDCDKSDVAKCLLGEGGQFCPQLRTTALDYLNDFLFQLTFMRHFVKKYILVCLYLQTEYMSSILKQWVQQMKVPSWSSLVRNMWKLSWFFSLYFTY